MSVQTTGRRIVWGIPDRIHPIINQPPGKIRFRFRKDGVGQCFIKDDVRITWFDIGYPVGATGFDGPWELWPIAINARGLLVALAANGSG